MKLQRRGAGGLSARVGAAFSAAFVEEDIVGVHVQRWKRSTADARTHRRCVLTASQGMNDGCKV